MDLKERHKDEMKYWDEEVEKLERDKKSLKFSNPLNYQQYFSVYLPYRCVLDFFGDIKDKVILDMACGTGWTSVYFARSGAKVYNFDISPKSVEIAQKVARDNGLGDTIFSEVMTAEDLKYEDNFFDFVFGNSALHHFDLEKAVPEIVRVLKPGGKASFIDDLRYHPLMFIYRRLFPEKHTHYEQPLSFSEIRKIGSCFSKMEAAPFGLFSLLPRNRALRKTLDPLDSF
ncbi:MAG: class I SAM-dependent methyltransferase, partial [candidate division Zixibacteria bacterium]|nr:class I SAM-dependent methyltransferase [candidate division Zixibacteria bacterium]